MRRLAFIIIAACIASECAGCSTFRSMFALDSSNDKEENKPIHNPFGPLPDKGSPAQGMVFRTSKGDRSVEVEVPQDGQDLSSFVIPVSPAFKDGRAPASDGDAGVDETYKARKPGMADREITGSFPHNSPQVESQRREVEQGMGLMPSEDETPQQDTSYLAAVDHVKQLFKKGRFEAALLEMDDLIKLYPTDPKLYEMRGTLFDRVGQPDLALKDWNQALRFEPDNGALRRFVARKQQRRSLASP